MESLKNIPNIHISLSPACFLLCAVRKERNKEFGLSSQAFFMQILRRHLVESGFFRFPLHFLPLQKRNDFLPDLTLAVSIFPSLSLLFKNYFSFAPLLHIREKVKKEINAEKTKTKIRREYFHHYESLYVSRAASALAFLYNSGLHTDIRTLSQSSIKEIGNYAKNALLKTTWMTRTLRELKPEGFSQIKGQEGLDQEKIRHEVFSYDKYHSDIGRGVEKNLQGKYRALKIPYINRMPLLSRDLLDSFSMFFFSQNVRKNSEAGARPGKNVSPEKPEYSEEKPFRNKGDSFSKYLTYDSHNTGEMILQRYVSLIPFIKGRSSISRNIFDITSMSHFSPNIHMSSQDAFISGWGAQRGIHTIQREGSARSESVSRSQHLTYSGKYNWKKLREEHMTSQGSSIERKSFLSESKTDFPPMIYAFPDRTEDSAGVKKETKENFEVKSSHADSSLSLNPQRSSPGSIPESDLVNLSDKVYSLIVERVKRERKMRGY